MRAIAASLASICLCGIVACSGDPTGSGGAGGTGGEGGTGPTGPACAGDPAPCEGRSSFDCVGFLGCNEDGACSGEAASCSSVLDEQLCPQQYGCVWAPSEGKCKGTPDPCPTLATSDLCAAQNGCTWQPGVCGGVPYDCETFSTEGICYGQPGCDWQ